jgi:hypothetical protein
MTPEYYPGTGESRNELQRTSKLHGSNHLEDSLDLKQSQVTHCLELITGMTARYASRFNLSSPMWAICIVSFSLLISLLLQSKLHHCHFSIAAKVLTMSLHSRVDCRTREYQPVDAGPVQRD